MLTPDQKLALSEGRDVPNLPAEVQDYYKEFFAHAGKDGLLALNDRLDARTAPGPEHPVDTVAASQQTALASGMLAVTNEHLGTGTTPDGKLVSAGSYTNLPADVRQLISGREQEYDSPKANFEANRQCMADRTRLADLLSHADQDVTGGRTFSTELARQGASMAAFIDGVDETGGILPPGFRGDEHDAIKNGAAQFLGVGLRNHEADYQLLTGLDVNTGTKLPADLSFGATGNDYATHRNYNPTKFIQTVINHDWGDGDRGKLASGLYDWTPEHIHDPGAEGELARKTIAALPDAFAPKHGASLVVAEDGKTYFQHTVDAFNKNPELANALARVSASNIDAFSQVDHPRGVAGPAVPLELDGAERMAFLSSQTHDGRATLDLARQQYENAVLYKLTHGGDLGGISPHDAVQQLAGLDAHINNAERNAQIYQTSNEIAHKNEQAQQAHDDKQQIADTVKGLVDSVPLPGGNATGAVKSVFEDRACQALMEGINPQPRPETVQFPSGEKAMMDGAQDFRDLLDQFVKESPPADPRTIDDFHETYANQYGRIVQSNLVKDNGDLEQLIRGGAQAPENPTQKK
ncbi:hypothetical protein D7D52_30765 [Nocardia yunnanensis]|uniref:TPR repeat domain-containing protein n=1 Tax=Nocardia yunnanensis TaxID=2382165 RepID=A0A386ZJA9_9NOCA|nr:hypothetical protein [Nocardia yunnanensis]AYF77470.1 hypothetical protein D7D52_30765 [Nocardia yunnanensis]